MSLKYRNLDQFGVVTDVRPFNLPAGAWSFAKNARFADGAVTRGPVFRTVSALGGVNATAPRHVFNTDGSLAEEQVMVSFLNGKIHALNNASFDDYTLSGYTPSSSDSTITHCHLGGLTYLNREDRVPWSITPGDTAFEELLNWNSGWRCKVLRSFNSSLVALNITKTGTHYPTMVKTSDILSDLGTVPGSWNEADASTNCFETVIPTMKGPIVDGLNLGDSFIIYGLNQSFIMNASSGQSVYEIRELPFRKGAINPNCVVEVNGQHYVFGPDDLWTHDGNTSRSLAGGKVRKFIYRTMNARSSQYFFAYHNEPLKEIVFCYVAADNYTSFSGELGCNRSAVYNYELDRWTFDDLPCVFSASSGVVNPTLAWADATSTWDSIGGSWLDQDDGFKRSTLLVGETNATFSLSSSLYVQEVYGEGSTTNLPVDSNATAPVYLERTGIDMDELDEESALAGYKHIVCIYPQGSIDPSGALLEFSFGCADFFGQSIQYSDYMTFDNSDLYKLDYTDAGRYLSVRVRYDDYRTFELTGVDLEVVVTGQI